MKNKPFVAITSVVGVAVIGGLLVFHAEQAPTPAAAQGQTTAPAVAVQTTHPKKRDVSRLIALPGDVRPWQEATLFAKVPGYLGKISVDKGDRVKAGQIIATIQAPELQADRDQTQQTYRSTLASAQGSRATDERTAVEQQRAVVAAQKADVAYQQALADAARAKALYQQTQGAVRQAEAQKQQLQASVEESQSQVQKAQADLESAQAEQSLADVTFQRYQGIYAKNPMLIAKQEVDVVESRANAAHSKTAAAQSALQAAQSHLIAVQAQVRGAAAQIDQAQSQVTAAREQVNSAEMQGVGMQKQLDLAAQDIAISKKQRAIAHAKVQEAQYQAGASRSVLGRAAAIADYARIRAPFDGTITKRFVDPGAFIQTASASQSAAAIATVADLSAVRIYINVPEVEARFIHVGTAVKIAFAGMPDAKFSGRVARTDGSLDSKTRSLLVEVDLPNHAGKILPGSYAIVKTVLETHPDVVSIPSLAVGSDKSGKFVFVVESGKAKRTAVTTGFEDGSFTEIQTGLNGQEEVVVTGRDSLTPNTRVQTTEWTPLTK